jgi:hypothetical protein
MRPGRGWSALLERGQSWAAVAALVQFRMPLLVPGTPRLPPRPWRPSLRLRRPHPRLHLRLLRPTTTAAGLAWLVLGLALFTVFLRMSRTVPVNSDGASNALQAWAMLHGNPLLRGWQLSDVSFYTTELPQYMLLETIRGLTPDVVHVAGAMTYTVLVLLAGMLAKGRATGRTGLLRAGLAMGIMLAPQAGNGIYVLMLSPDHVGSTIPVLLAWLLVDRAPRRWWVPPAVALLLTWALTADSIVLLTGIVPLAAVGAARGYQAGVRDRRGLRGAWFELLLVAAAGAAVAGSGLVLALIASHGGFYVWPVGNELAPFTLLPGNLMLTLQGILLLFGANFLGQNAGYVAALAAAHLVGIGLAAWAVGAALRRWARLDLAVQLAVASLLVSLVAYLCGRNALDVQSTREFTAVLPFGAALAGRLLARRLRAAAFVPALAGLLTAYLLGLAQVVTLPAVPAQGSQLAAWLSARHLTYGLSGYWQSNVVTLDSGGRVRIRALLAAGPKVIADDWETEPAWYNPALHQANFIVLSQNAPAAQPFPPIANVRATFGQPVSISYVGQYTVMVWNKNLLSDLHPQPDPATGGQPAATSELLHKLAG